MMSSTFTRTPAEHLSTLTPIAVSPLPLHLAREWAAERAEANERASRHPRYQFSPGQAVTWLYTPRRGYGYTQAVPAVVISVTNLRVVIQVRTWRGETVQRVVSPERLRVAGGQQ
jgi:hypothetical protein